MWVRIQVVAGQKIKLLTAKGRLLTQEALMEDELKRAPLEDALKVDWKI